MKQFLIIALAFYALCSVCGAQTTNVKILSNDELKQELTKIARERILLFDKGDKEL